MATGNNRDVKMTLSVETLGTDEIKKLQDDVQKLAREGGDAAPEFQKLADQIGRLGAQADALRTFEQLAETTQKVADKQTEAAQKTDALAEKLEAARALTQAASTAQERAAKAYLESQQEVSRLAGELQKLRSGVGDAEKGTAKYDEALRKLIEAKTKATQETKRLQAEQRAANESLSEAESSESKLERQYNRSVESLAKRSEELNKANKVLDESRKAAEAEGLATQNLADSQATLIRSLNDVGAAARKKADALKEVAEADRLFEIQSQNRERLYKAGREAYLAEIEAQKEAAALTKRLEAEKSAAVEAAAAAAVAARKREQEESDRLYEIQRQTRERLEIAARQALAAESQAQREAADLTIRLEAEKRSAIEQSARANAQAITNAFSTVGMRGANELRAEIDKVRAAMDTLSTQAGLTGAELKVAMASGNAQIRELERELRGATGQLTLADRAAGLLKNSMGQIAAGNLIADGIASIVERVKEMGRAFIEVTLQAESMRKGLTAIYKDGDVAAQQIEFLRRTAIGAGVSVAGLADDFVRFSAATKSSGISLQTTNEVFAAVTTAASSLGLGAEKTSLALNALGQIASKGVVSMEELRQQLGDAVPGALSLTAKGLGLTDAELVKLVESGQLAARDFFPAFSKGLGELQGETDGVRQTWERFKNVLTIAAQATEANGGLLLLSGTLKVFGGLLGAITLGLSVLAEGLFTAGRAAILFFEALRGNGKTALEWFREETDKTLDRLAMQANAFNQMLNPTKEGAAALAQAAQATGQVGDAARGATDSIKFNTDAIIANGQAATSTQAGALALAKANEITSGTTVDASNAWAKLNVEMTKMAQQQEQLVTVAEKQAKAVELEGQALERLATLRGDEVASREAAVVASTNEAAARDKVATARENEVAVLRVQLAEMVKMAIAQDGSTTAREQEIRKIQEKIEKLDAEAQSARNAADSARIASEQRKLDVQIAKDNADAIDKLRAARDAALTTLRQTQQAEEAGIATKKQLRDAEIAAAAAVRLYNDALNDKIKRMEASRSMDNAELQMTNAKYNARLQELKSLEALAKANGDENLAAYAKIEQKRVEIQMIQATVKAQIIEQEGIIATTKMKMQEAKERGTLTEAMRIEMEASIKAAEAKIVEAKARGQSVGAIEAEIKALREGANAKNQNGAAGIGASRAVDGEADSRKRNADAIDRETSALERQNKAKNLTSDGFARNKDGSAAGTFNNNLPVDQAFAVMQAVNKGDFSGITLEQAQAAYKQASNAKQWIDAQSAGTVSLRAMSDTEGLLAAARTALEALGGSVNGGSGINTNKPSQQIGQGQSGGTTTVKINIGGRSTTVNAASKGDADALVSLLKQLESAAGTSA